MLKLIEKVLKEKPVSYQKKFFNNCKIIEKVDAFYFHVKIISKELIRFYKADYNKLTSVDMIINKMWVDPYNDFIKIFCSNPDFMDKYIGFTFSFFYFPVSKPMTIDYGKHEWKYILNYVKDAKGQAHDISEFDLNKMSELIRKDSIVLNNGERSIDDKKNISKMLVADSYDRLYDTIKSLVDNSKLIRDWAHCEGFILKYKNDNYQFINIDVTKDEHKTGESNGLAFQFLIHELCSFISKFDYSVLLHSNDYIKFVCCLFNEYIKNGFDKDKFAYYGIKAEQLAAPNNNYYPGTCYMLVPNKKTRELIQENPLYDNIFKIMLNGLRKNKKKCSENSLIILTKNDIDEWNNCVSFIDKMVNTDLFVK